MTLPEELIPVNQNDSKVAVTCPYLGTLPDPHTSVAYPSGANYCHRADNPQLVSLAHQTQHCLAEAFDNCATYRDELILVSSIDVAGPVKTQVNWKRPLAVVGLILLFGVLLIGAYALFSPFSTETVDASTPIKRESETTTLASNLTPTPTRVVNAVGVSTDTADTGVVPSEAGQQEALAEDAETEGATSVDSDNENTSNGTSIDNTSADDASEDAKMAPLAETPTPKATSKSEQETADEDPDDEDSGSSVAFESTPETQPLPTASTAETELAATVAAATAMPATEDGIIITDGTAVIRTGALNVRTGAGPQYPSTALVYNGEHVILIGRNGDSSWVKIRSLNGFVGWVYAKHIESAQPLEEIPFIPRSQR